MIKNRIPSIWTGMYAELPLHEALLTLSSQGWQSFEISTEHLCDIEAAKRPGKLIDQTLDICVKNNLITLQAHGSLKANVAHPDETRRDDDVRQLTRHIDLASNLGIKNIVIHPGVYLGATTRSDRKHMTGYNVKAFRELGNHAAQLSMKIALENLPTRTYSTPDELLGLIEAIDHEAIGITFDSSHAQMTQGLDLVSAIHDFGNRIICTHLSDNDGSGDQHKIPGSGTIDWAAVMQAFSAINYAGVINLEVPGDRHSDPGLRALNSLHALQVADYLLDVAEGEG